LYEWLRWRVRRQICENVCCFVRWLWTMECLTTRGVWVKSQEAIMIQLELYTTSPAGFVKTRICTSSVLVTSISGLNLQTMSHRKRFLHFTRYIFLCQRSYWKKYPYAYNNIIGIRCIHYVILKRLIVYVI